VIPVEVRTLSSRLISPLIKNAVTISTPDARLVSSGWRLLSAHLALVILAMPCQAQGVWKKHSSLPEARGVAGAFAGVSGDRLFVAGGANFPDKMPWEGGKKAWSDTAWMLDSPEGEWREAGKLPQPLAYGVSVSVNGCVLCIGGSNADRHFADVFALEWKDGKLEQNRTVPPALPILLANAAGAVDADRVVYVACGSSEPGEKAASNRVFAAGYGWKTLTWRELPRLPAEPRILPVAAAHGKSFYLFGGTALDIKDGKTVRRYLQDAWRYTFDSGWQRLADMPVPRAAAPSPAPVVQSDGHPCVLIAGGDDGSLVNFTPVEKHPGFPGALLRYDLSTNTWSTSGKCPAPRATVPCVEWHTGFFFPSGEVRPGVRSPEVWELARTAEKE
jgi:N-acetylneuraminate epimerase